MRTAGLDYPSRPPRPALLGEAASWSVRSSRDPEVLWTVKLYPDGHWECECEAFRYESRPDGLCRHIDECIDRWLPGFPELA
jgi:hypothetical protein